MTQNHDDRLCDRDDYGRGPRRQLSINRAAIVLRPAQPFLASPSGTDQFPYEARRPTGRANDLLGGGVQ